MLNKENISALSIAAIVQMLGAQYRICRRTARHAGIPEPIVSHMAQ